MTRLVCRATGESYAGNERIWRSASGGLLDIDFTPALDPGRVAGRPRTLWRYREALPLPADARIVSFDEGCTPLTRVLLGGREVLMKQDHLFPSGSYKDRGATLLISKVLQLGISHIVEDSSGNAGCAIAAYAAAAGVQCEIYVPASTSSAKLVQLAAYGARVVRVPGSREETARRALEAAAPSYYASHSWNPFFLHGTKTFAYEVAEQLGWRSPDVMILPAGNGTLLLATFIGFQELLAMGLVTRLPRLVAVQTSACAPLFEAYQEGGTTIHKRTWGDSIAEGIVIAEPVRGGQILASIRASGGSVIVVTDEEIVSATTLMARRGFFIEPTAGATVAGVLRYLESSVPGETIVSVFTGHGLKSSKVFERLIPVS